MEDMFEHNGIFLHFTMMLNFIKSQVGRHRQRSELPLVLVTLSSKLGQAAAL